MDVSVPRPMCRVALVASEAPGLEVMGPPRGHGPSSWVVRMRGVILVPHRRACNAQKGVFRNHRSLAPPLPVMQRQRAVGRLAKGVALSVSGLVPEAAPSDVRPHGTTLSHRSVR